MANCNKNCGMELIKNPCRKSDFPCNRCISKQKNTGKVFYVFSAMGLSSLMPGPWPQWRPFPTFGQKLFWDFFPNPDPCDETVREPYITIKVEGSNEKQVVTIEGTPVGGYVVVGGYFTLKYYGQTTDRIPYNASASKVQVALAALTSIGAGDVSVTGIDGGPWTVNFIGDLAGTHVWFLEADSSNLIEVGTYEPVPGLSEEDTSLVECVCGIAGYVTFDGSATWSKTPTKVVPNGVELIIYLYFLRGTWRLTLRFTDYWNGSGLSPPSYATITRRAVAHYSSTESACFIPETKEFQFESDNGIVLFNGIEGPDSQIGPGLTDWPETIFFETRDIDAP